MNFLELAIPNTNPMILRLEAIDSITLQPARDGSEEILAIKIASWVKPFTYEGQDAGAYYDRLREVMAAPTL
jgi:hypothetical protein